MNITEIADTARRVIVKLEGKVTVSEFYLSDSDGERLEFCMPPEQIRVKTTANFRTFNVIESGEIQIPKGEKLTQISWRGTLPGAPMLLNRFIKTDAWEHPDELIKVLRRWREHGTKLKLLVTQTPINLDVYIKSIDFTHRGGLGNVDYSIDFIAAKALQVRTIQEADAQRNADSVNAFELLERQLKKNRASVMLATVDTIYEVALILTGNGGNWLSILQRNGLGLADLDSIDPTIILN